MEDCDFSEPYRDIFYLMLQKLCKDKLGLEVLKRVLTYQPQDLSKISQVLMTAVDEVYTFGVDSSEIEELPPVDLVLPDFDTEYI